MITNRDCDRTGWTYQSLGRRTPFWRRTRPAVPYDEGLMSHGDGLTQVSPNLYWYRDTCNVYLLARGAHGLLIDFGSGGVLDHLHEAGVREVEWVLHTHHHRDQCQGDPILDERGIPIAVPEREMALFVEADAFWRLKRIYDNYDVSSIGHTLAR